MKSVNQNHEGSFCLLPTGNWRLPTSLCALRYANLKISATPQKKAHQWQAFLSNFWFEELFDHDAFCGYIAIGGPNL